MCLHMRLSEVRVLVHYVIASVMFHASACRCWLVAVLLGVWACATLWCDVQLARCCVIIGSCLQVINEWPCCLLHMFVAEWCKNNPGKLYLLASLCLCLEFNRWHCVPRLITIDEANWKLFTDINSKLRDNQGFCKALIWLHRAEKYRFLQYDFFIPGPITMVSYSGMRHVA